MATGADGAWRSLFRILDGRSVDEEAERLRPKSPDEVPLPPRVPAIGDGGPEAVERRRALLRERGAAIGQLTGDDPPQDPRELSGNIEGFIGWARLPMGLVGPLRVNGTAAQGDHYVPLATTEGALIASLQRGAWLLSRAGGVTALCLVEAVSRAPCFVFADTIEAGRFLAWLIPRFEELQGIVAAQSRHARLEDLRISQLGRELFLLFSFTTGDAAGQNMVTLAVEAICEHLVAHSPVAPKRWYLEGNMSGDKKATLQSYTSTRGKKVTASARIPRELVHKFLKCEPRQMVDYWQVSVLGGVQSGSIGVQGHFANALTALFIACGQDVACVAEASVGVTRLDLDDDGALYAAVSLPNLIVGTHGGGTRLTAQRECLELLGCTGEGSARAFAEICAALILAGELSIIGSQAAGDFAQAHADYGRHHA